MVSRKKHLKWLDSQLPSWTQAGLISADQAAGIRGHYTDADGSLARLAFTVIGATLFGLGVILFFAWNWDALHRFTKLGIVLSAIAASHAGGQWLLRPQSSHRIAGEGLALLGTLLFGAGIWLVSQIYHIDEHWPNAFLLWGVAALAMAWAMPSVVQAVLAVSLLAVWSGAEALAFRHPQLSGVWLMLLGVLPLAWRLRSRVVMFAGLCGFYSLLAFQLGESLKESLFYVLYSMAVVYLALGLWLDRKPALDFQGLRDVMVIPAYAVILSIVFALSFGDISAAVRAIPTGQAVWFWGSLACALLVSMLAVLPRAKWDAPQESDVLQMVLAVAGLLLCYAVGPGWLAMPGVIVAFMMNLLFVGHCLLFVVHGSRIQRGGEVALGCLLFAALVFARYSDLFESLLSRSLVFLVLGASLFVVGNFYSRHKPVAVREVQS
ncbi:MAG TPA: DUF2157 domain-containing protein [Pseudomonadales bacterium]